MPDGYRKGHHKYVIVVGTVMSGLGKGIFSSSLAKLLQDKGLTVAPIKMEGYYNIDSRTLNPYRHGEVFVLDDGMETDMDLATYERLLDQDLSQAAQLGIKQVMQMGLQPHLIACRCNNPVNEKVRQKISMSANVPMRRVMSMHDVSSIYLIPEALREGGIDREVLTLLDLHDRVDQRAEDVARRSWAWFVERIGKARKEITIAVTGKYVALRDAYASIIKAAEHCGVHLGVDVKLKWIDTTLIDRNNVANELEGCHGIIVPGGFGSRGVEGKIECIRYARENKMPYLGLCLGFQMAVIESARNVCGIRNANSSEFEPNCQACVIDTLPEQKKIEGLGGNMRLGGKDIDLTPGSLASRLFNNATQIRLRFRHRYEVDPKFVPTLEKHSLIFSGKHPTQPIMQILELPREEHPFFMGTQAHPELTSRPLRPQPMFLGLVQAAMELPTDHGKSHPTHHKQPQPAQLDG